ncbi:permease family-domain-containing protein [Halteromyces radiatus]|uniref:permease family-domain-containing protein n=1 Tax=Halteromyces radiatus TaxID=101107 RepID=UPI0022204C45|nr:permease family-domain-containing protein [Halteromyces radiatus]KAI8092923.1 permease family-domain-containing protein [Halteromyces radiatus]
MDNKSSPSTSTLHMVEDTEGVQTKRKFAAYEPVKEPALWRVIKDQMKTKEGWWGDLGWASLCLPPFFIKEKKPPAFWGLNSRLPLGLAAILGFQHSLAMISGVVTPILLITATGSTSLNLDPEDQQYLLSAALITSAFLSFIQITRFRLFKTNFYLGSGLLSLMGPNFASIPATQAVISNMYANGYCPTEIMPDGTIKYLACRHAWGAILGTSMLCSVFEMAISFLPPKTIRRLFPPVVSGATILLIGCSVISTALKDWAGGSGPCANRPSDGFFAKCPNIDAPHALPWGSPEYLGLGLLVFITIVLVENLGSAFMKNAQIVIGLVVGTIVAAATGYVDPTSIQTAPAITFVWTRTFPISLYPPAIIPFLIVYLDNILESIGDITATCDVSGVEVEGPHFQRRIQGGLLADGFGSLIAACMTLSPMVTFAQNNGVIALTRCANRVAGYFCCLFLLIYGVFGKISAVFLVLPSSVIGGMNAFLFASVTVSGIRILAYLSWTRRDRFIVTCALSLGLGVLLTPGWFSHVFSYQGNNEALKGFLSAVETVVGTSYCIGSLLAILLEQIVPREWGNVSLAEEEKKKKEEMEKVRNGFLESDIDLGATVPPTTIAASDTTTTTTVNH